MDKIIWIVDNPYGDKFTATRADANVTSDITREEAKAMLGADAFGCQRKPMCNAEQFAARERKRSALSAIQ